MKHSILVLIFTSIFSQLQADIYIDGINIIGLGSLLNQSSFILTNDGATVTDCQFEIKVRHNGNLVQSAVLNNVAVQSGTTTLSLNSSSTNYNLSGTRGRLMSSFNWVAPGAYVVCIEVLSSNSSLAQECETYTQENDIFIEHLSPDNMFNLNDLTIPVLNFCWTSNVPSDNAVQYILSIYPVYSTQTIQDAVLNNNSIYEQSSSGVCLSVPNSIMISSGFTEFAWNLKIQLLDAESSESPNSITNIELGESTPSELNLTSEELIEYCYIVPELTGANPTAYPVADCNLQLDLDEFYGFLPDSIEIEFRDSLNNFIGSQVYTLVNKKRFQVLNVNQIICNHQNIQLACILRVGNNLRHFKIIFKP